MTPRLGQLSGWWVFMERRSRQRAHRVEGQSGAKD